MQQIIPVKIALLRSAWRRMSKVPAPGCPRCLHLRHGNPLPRQTRDFSGFQVFKAALNDERNTDKLFEALLGWGNSP